MPLNDHVLRLGPYTILTVDEGYAAVTQNNGKQMVLAGGTCHFLNHKVSLLRSKDSHRQLCVNRCSCMLPQNWKFEKFMSLKIQTDDLERIHATSADNIEMSVTSTINWRIFDVNVAATMAAETMGKKQSRKKTSINLRLLQFHRFFKVCGVFEFQRSLARREMYRRIFRSFGKTC